jgi:hypothetical protein
MLNLLLKLRDNDVRGPVIPTAALPTNLARDNDATGPVMEMSQKPLAERCCNYSSQQCYSAVNDRVSANNAPSILSQDFWNFNESGDDYMEDPEGDTCSVRRGKRTLTRNQRNVFEKLNPVFKALVCTIKSTEATIDDIEEAFQDMLNLDAQFKERFSRKSRTQPSSSNFVSSSLADNPRRKTHGTKHM